MYVLHKIVFALFFTVIASPAISQYSYRELIHLPWGTNNAETGFRKAPGGQFGPMSFKVEKDTILLLDSQNQYIKIFQNNLFLDKTGLPLSNADDFIWKNSNHYFLLSENSLFEFKDQKILRSFSPNSPRDMISSLVSDKNKNVYAVLNESNSINIKQNGQRYLFKGAADSRDFFVQITKTDRQTIHVQIGQNGSFNIISPKSDLGSAKFIGSTPEGNFYIYVEKIEQQIPLRVNREIQLYSMNGYLKATFIIPTHAHTFIFKEFYVDKEGNLFHMISAKDGIHIIGWVRNGKPFHGTPVFLYPDKFQNYYHYNSYNEKTFLKKSTGPIKKKKETLSFADFPPVSRREALAIGETYVQHVWTASSDNLTFGRIRDRNGVEIETPGWVQIGANKKLPYQWGGFWTLSEFDRGLQDGKFAGDIATTGVSSQCVGVDCSGFVSRCWKLLSHYSTRMMDDYIAAAYHSWQELKPGDAIHKPGHVRLFVGFNPNGSLLTVESSGRDWRVSYRSYYLSDLSFYVPRYYIFMEGMPGSIVKPELTSVCFDDNVQVRWQLPDSSSIAGFHLYTGSGSDNWMMLEDEQTLIPGKDSTQLELNRQEPVFFKMASVSSLDDSTESYPTDVYGYLNTGSKEKILIVDGFDRTTGSYPFSYHPFAMTMGKALASLHSSFETVCNEAIIDRSIRLEDYDAVIWLLGDESTKDETFSNEEQNFVKRYLQQGGRMFITGSEVAWDLDYKGSSNDKSFISDYFKTRYEKDDSGSYTANGEIGTVFAGLTLHYDDGTKGVYEEDWPDAFRPVSGSYTALKYDNGLIAATAFSGAVPNGKKAAKLLLLGFPFETIYEESERIALMERVLQFFDMTPTLVTEQETEKPRDFTLYGNYPNPFNPGTFIHYQLFSEENVRLKIYDILGRQIRILIDEKQSAGKYNVYWDGLDEKGNSVPSGIYVYYMQTKSAEKSRKMMLLK